MGNTIEPVSAVHLNDELLGAKASIADAEAEILIELTEKVELISAMNHPTLVIFD